MLAEIVNRRSRSGRALEIFYLLTGSVNRKMLASWHFGPLGRYVLPSSPIRPFHGFQFLLRLSVNAQIIPLHK